MNGQESQRQLKVSRLLQKDLSEIFQRDLPHLFTGAFVTVTGVKISPDLSVANVYLSFMLAKNPLQLMDIINENHKAIRSALATRVRHQLRLVPELRYFLDETPDEAQRMERLLSSLNIPKDGTEETAGSASE